MAVKAEADEKTDIEEKWANSIAGCYQV